MEGSCDAGHERVLTVNLPKSSYVCWAQLPQNPALGFVVPKQYTAMNPEDYRFYCDSCQRGFGHAQQWQEHLAQHVYCTIPGCRFTCRRDKQYKMDIHMELLHNRPDAPNLNDTAGYLRSRATHFPTGERIAAKIEELFYKASRGEILPQERRRWLRGHGVNVGMRRRRERNTDAEAPAPRRPKLIPLGPGNSLTKAQRVQIIREKYQGAVAVPKFYVCNRCGCKGDHWVDECPTKGDTAFDRKVSWGEPRVAPPHPQPLAPPKEEAASSQTSSTRSARQCSPDFNEDKEAYNGADVDAPVEHDAHREPASLPLVASPPQPEPLTTSGPVGRGHSRGGRGACQAPRAKVRPPPPTLFDKLIEGERIAERGLLLQAIRFFIHEGFFSNDPAELGQE